MAEINDEYGYDDRVDDTKRRREAKQEKVITVL